MLKKAIILIVVFLLGFFTASILSYYASLLYVSSVEGLYFSDQWTKAKAAMEEGRYADAVQYRKNMLELYPVDGSETAFSESLYRRDIDQMGIPIILLHPLWLGIIYFASSDLRTEASSKKVVIATRAAQLMSLAEAQDKAGDSKGAYRSYREAAELIPLEKYCNIAGEYYTFCDCGTNTTITLQKDGKAEIEAYHEGDTQKMSATWSCKDAVVELRYNDTVDTLIYTKRAAAPIYNGFGYEPALIRKVMRNEEKSLLGGARDTYWFTGGLDYDAWSKKVLGDALVGLSEKDIAFLEAIKSGNEAGVAAQIKQGANVNLRDANSSTPLMYAVEAKNINIVRMLLDHGADVNAVDNYKGPTHGNRAIYHAAGSDDTSIAIMKLLVARNAECNEINAWGETLLTEVIRMSGHNKKGVDLLKYLVSTCADINVPDSDGKTPIQILEERKLPEVVKALKEANAARISQRGF